MPINNQDVQFCFINNNTPSSYDDNTIYFDNRYKQIKVGSNTIASDDLHIYFDSGSTPLTPGSFLGAISDIDPNQIFAYLNLGKNISLHLLNDGKVYYCYVMSSEIQNSDMILQFSPIINWSTGQMIIVELEISSSNTLISIKNDYFEKTNT